MTTQTTSTPRPMGFGFRPAAAPAATPAPAASAPVQAAPLEAAATGQTPAAEIAIAEEPTGEIERVTIMLPSGGREGQVFGGVFGKMVGNKFHTDELLKRIYLLQLVDGAEPGEGIDQAKRDLMAALGGLPETVTISVPVELVPSLKATLAHLSGARWENLFAQTIASANPMTKFALSNEARVAKEAVTQITQIGGELFTVHVAAPKEVRFVDTSDEFGNDGYGPSLEPLQQPVAGDVVTTALAGYVEPEATGHDVLAAAYQGRQEGDTATYKHVQLFTVIASDAVAAERVLALIPASLKQPTAQTVADVHINGQPFVMTQPLVDDESHRDIPR